MRRTIVTLLAVAAAGATGAAARAEAHAGLLASDGTAYHVDWDERLGGERVDFVTGSNAVIAQGQGALLDPEARRELAVASSRRPLVLDVTSNCIRTGAVSIFGTAVAGVRSLTATTSDGRRFRVDRHPASGRAGVAAFARIVETGASGVTLRAYDARGRLFEIQRHRWRACPRRTDLPRIAATSDSAVITVGQTDEVTYRLRLPSRGAEPASYRVEPRVPAFVAGHDPFASADPLDPYGTPIVPMEGPRLEGPGTLTAGSTRFAVGGSSCRRGFTRPVGFAGRVTVPAGATTTIVQRFRVSAAPLWPVTDYRVTYRVRSADAPSRFVRPRRPTVTGTRGVRIVLRTPSRAPAGRAIRVTGFTQPRTPRRLVALVAATAGGAERRMGLVETDGGGRFAFRWRPAARRVYDVWAVATPAGGARGDLSCRVRVDAR